MDPFTVLQTVGAAGELAVICMRACQKLYEFAGEVKVIEKTLSRIEDEVQDLDRTLRTVDAGLNDHSVKRAAKSRVGQDILGMVQTSVDRSVYCLGKLRSVLEIIIGEPNDSSPLRALRQTVRSTRKQKELNECLTQIDKTKQSLNLGLTTLSVHIVASMPQFRRGGAEEEIAPLTKQLESVLQAPMHTEDNRIRRTAVTVLQRAKSPPPEGQTLSRATTLLAEEPDDMDATDDSDSRDPQEPVKKWIRLLESNKASVANTRRGSMVKSFRDYPSFDNGPDLDNSPLTEPANERFQIMLARKAITSGNSNYENKNYEQAAAQMEEALKTASILSRQAKTFLERDLIRIRLNLSYIYTTQEKHLDLAEQHLLQAVIDICQDKRAGEAEMQHQLYNAYNTLARVYVLDRKYGEAQAYCEDALNGHLALTGEESRPYFDSLQMLIKIYSAQGNTVRAQLCLEQLPPELKERVKKQVQTGFSSPQAAHGFQIPQQTTKRHVRGGGFVQQKRVSAANYTPGQLAPTMRDLNIDATAGPPGNVPPSRGESLSDQVTELQELAAAGFAGDFDPDEALAWAIKEDKQRIVHALINPPGLMSFRKRTLGSTKAVSKLANVNGSGRKGMRDSAPLILATTTSPGRVMIAKLLLERGAAKNIRDEQGRSLLEVAAMHGQQEIISVLLDENISGSIGVASRATPNGSSVRSGEAIRAYLLAAHYCRVNVLSLFIGRGIKPDAVDLDHGYGRTAVHTAAGRGHDAAVSFLINHGADPNLPDRAGSTPLMASVREGHVTTTKLLLRLLADVNAANSRGQTALIIAAEQGQTDAARMILEEPSIEPDAKDNNGWTPLIWAVNRRHTAIVRLLLQHGEINVNGQCNRGSRPLDHARGSRELSDLLKAMGAQPGTGVKERVAINNEYKGYVLI